MAEKEYIERDKAIDACFDGWNNNAHDCAENIRAIPAADVPPLPLWTDEPISGSEFMTHNQGQHGFEIHFRTDNKAKYEAVQEECRRQIGHAKPAADAIEELQKRVPKSGVWREEESGYDDVFYECSVCGAGICTVDGDPVDNAWSYCPECGAKMTGVERLPEPPKEE